MDHKISRLASTPMGVFGFAEFGEFKCYSLERPWLNNAPSVSCIPLGTYTLEKHDSAAHPGSLALVNHDLGVSHYPVPGMKRNLILIHVANTIDDIEGCIGLGVTLGCVNGKWAVTRSTKATKKAFQILKPGDTIEITEAKTDY